MVLLAFSCRRADDARDDDNMQDTLEVMDTDVDSDGVHVADADSPDTYAEFRTTGGSVDLRLREPMSRVNLQALGPANDTLTRNLTVITDAYQGSTVTEYQYDDINLVYIRPRNTSDSWLMTAEIKGGNWATARGIKVGDSVADLRSMYPNITDYKDDAAYQHSYVVDDATILFGVANDKVSRIKIMYDIP